MFRSSVGEAAHEGELLAKAASWPELTSVEELTPAAAQAVASAQGIDFATALIYDRVRRRLPEGLGTESMAQLERNSWARLRERSARIVIVPGAFYLESRHTGADGRLIRDDAERNGVASSVVPTESFGSLARNAEILRKWLRCHRGQELVLVSLSKGGLEVKKALCEDDEVTFEHVSVWINLSGITEGTGLVDWLLARQLRSCGVRLLFRLRGYDFRLLEELRHTPAAWPSDVYRLPEHLRAVHVVGFPLAHHLSSRLARRGHRRLAALGPNDGAGIILAEAARRPGIVYPVWGADHYLRPAGNDISTIIRGVLNQLDAWNDQASSGRHESLEKSAVQ